MLRLGSEPVELPEPLGQLVAKIGITTLPARTAALANLAATILSDLLGISKASAADWAATAGGDWGLYAAYASRRYQRPSPPGAGRTPQVDCASTRRQRSVRRCQMTPTATADGR